MTPQHAQFPWFCNDVEGEGITWHATQDAALAHAKQCIAEWRIEAGEWPEEAECVVVGCVSHRATPVNIEACGDGCHQADDWQCDIEMRPLQEYNAERRAWRQAQKK